MDKSVSVRVGWIIICCLFGFVFPLAFLIAAWLAVAILSDLSESKLEPPTSPDDQLDYSGLKSLRANHNDWLDRFCAFCESPAEVAFLETMVKAFKLLPQNGVLNGKGLSLRLQVPIRPYRLDFLVDERLVVEVDGAAWHSSPEAVENDKKRDLYLEGQGYIVLRIPAKVTLYNSKKTLALVQDARLKAAEKIEKLARDISISNAGKTEQRQEILRPKNLFKSVQASLEATGDVIIDLHRKTQICEATAKGKNEVAIVWETQRAKIEMVLKHARFMLEIESKLQRNSETREPFFETLNSITQRTQSDTDLVKSPGDYSNILELINFTDFDQNVENDTELCVARQKAREQSILIYNKYMESVNIELQDNPSLASMFHKVCENLNQTTSRSP